MESLVHAFGIDISLLLAQAINFAILATALTWFLYKPVLKLMRERQALIEKGLSDAKESTELRSHLEVELVEERKRVEKETKEKVEAVRLHVADLQTELLQEARDKAEALAEDIRTSALEEARKTEKNAEKEIAKLAVLAAQKVLEKK